MSDRSADTTRDAPGPVLFAYDGSDLAKLAIAEAARQLRPGRDAIVLTIWQTFDVGFLPPHELAIDAAQAGEVEKAAQDTAAAGASLAKDAGFNVSTATARASPAWQGIIDAADHHGAGLIALGSHGRTGLGSVLIGSVAEAVAAHSKRSVLIVHRAG